ncbi:MAG: Holliday junction branch migration protein RuvA [Eubacteriales bacterium]|nr:Holliday junction branch migration protein RuvA [Bacillota bacterium]MBV1727072.1 Holliday junction branch migration protein RuvA [Desulforudis sp.]MDQ7789399.1 Holliday junction branch migration protein RuvA [Clostridia bacterium]MDZ4042320.1 Holliday junction branch migration protein RuvA [Eubacteriales bacterium]MBU4533126.1 Holliday junction branch migration protein RuvA [Bacillota bacterium]
MIAHVNGTLADVFKDAVIVEVGGIGLHVQVPTNVLSHLPSPGQKVRLYTHLAVREDGMELFGFREETDRVAFLQLLAVGGIGPKTALAAISQLGTGRLWSAILQEDAALLSTVPGIGKKIAQRVIVELKDRIQKQHLVETELGTVTSASGEALAALVALGCNEREAVEAIRLAGPQAQDDTAELVRAALRNLGK